jgi:RNA polymerase sigma-70 factor (ECF subfamily)
MKEEDCIRELASGNIASLEQLYNLMKTTVYAVALSIVRNKDRAEDVVQETFIRVYAKADRYTPDTNPKAWVISIARNLAYDSLRNQRDTFVSVNFEESYMQDETEKLGIRIDENILNRMELTEELLKLGEIERQIVVMHVVGGLKHSEISEVLKMPMGTVRWKYSNILKKLSDKLGGSENGAWEKSSNCIGNKK